MTYPRRRATLSHPLRSNQEEQPDIGPVEVMPDSVLDDWLIDYSEEEIEAIVDLWQRYAGKLYKNVIVAEEE